jgi:hypothetical protein
MSPDIRLDCGQWFRYVTGILEVSGAIGVLIPRFRFWAASQIAVIMMGATFINVTVLHVPSLARVTAILMALALAVAWSRRPQSVRGEKASEPAVPRPVHNTSNATLLDKQ